MPRDPHAWRDDAACPTSGLDPDTWLSGSATPVEAMRVCVGCSVRVPCLEYALSQPTWEDTGVWGGTSESARRQIRHGRLDPQAAMDRGDEVAHQRTRDEVMADEEPWLLGGAA